MSSSNNRLRQLIPLHGRRSDLVKGKVQRATKSRVAPVVKSKVGWYEAELRRNSKLLSQHRKLQRMTEKRGEYRVK